MNHFKLLPLMLIAILLTSCKNENHDKELQEAYDSPDMIRHYSDEDEVLQNDSLENDLEDQNFPILGFDQMEFLENVDGYDGSGAILKATFTMKNNTPETITKFNIKYFMKIVYKDGEFHYFPESMEVSNENNDEKRFAGLNYFYFEKDLEKEEIWKPNTEKKFDIIIFHESLANHKYSINHKYFKRTPVEANFSYKYFASGIDNEYENTMDYNVINFWKQYQQKIGLR